MDRYPTPSDRIIATTVIAILASLLALADSPRRVDCVAASLIAIGSLMADSVFGLGSLLEF